ncbi:hypothetical protein [Streptomyces venezuelae]|uniref:YxiG-like protein n=1 Tax=Streptomyces venezuelae TaxID=54571 RepID=UPI003664023E
MDIALLEQHLEETFDHAVVHHGYVTYMRDYEVIVHATADPRTGVPPAYLRHLFRYCVEARCETSLAADTWRESLDDRLLDHETADPDLGGYVWGVNCHAMYPGASLVRDSKAAERWSKEIGIDFHEVRIETNAHDLTLVFSDLEVSEVPVGYAPFVTD